MTPEPSAPPLHPSLVLGAYVEPLVKGRRVAVLGDATLGLADLIAERGARLVHAYDPDRARAAEALARAAPRSSPTVTVAVFEGELGVRDGAFDVVVIPNLSIFADPTELLRRARRLVGSGVAVVASPNLAGGSGGRARRRLVDVPRSERAPGYYELYDLVSLQFPRVRMVGQAPFVGYAVVDFAAGPDPEVSIDTSLLGGSEEPEHFIAVGSERLVVLEPFSVVELPWAGVVDGLAQAEAPSSSRADERLALTEAQTRLALVVAELETVRERHREAEARSLSASALSARVAELESELDVRTQRLKEVEARAGDSHVRAERLGHDLRDLDEEVRRQRERGTRLSKQLDDEKKGRTKAELELGMLRGKPEIAGSRDRIDALAGELEAARAKITELEEAAETRRRGTTPPATDAPPAEANFALVERIGELEGVLERVLEDERRTRAELEAGRAEAAGKARALEGRLEAERTARIELTAQLQGDKHRRAEVDTVLQGERQRKAELEAALQAERQRKAELETALQGERQRKAELEAALQGERQRKAELEAALQGDRKAKVEADAHGQADRRGRADLEAHLQSERQARVALEAQLQAEKHGRAEAEKLARVEAERHARADAEKHGRVEVEKHARAEAEARRALEAATREHQKRMAEGEGRAAQLAGRVVELERKIALLTQGSPDDGAGAEVAGLESALRDRGRAVASLTRELRESERVGRELLADLEALAAARGLLTGEALAAMDAPLEGAVTAAAPLAALAAGDPEVQERFDLLAAGAARAEADLQAAAWRIAQLERELAEAEGGPPSPTVIQVELEEALAAAREEVATLRRALGAAGRPAEAAAPAGAAGAAAPVGAAGETEPG